MQGLSGFDLPPSGKVLLKATGRICKKEQSVFHLSEPSAFTASFREMDRQWLSSLNPVLSEDSPNPGEQSVAKPTEPARFLRSTWVVSG